jgi:hypothetical protein
MEYLKKPFGQKFIDYLGPKNFNLMPVSIKKEIIYTKENSITMRIKKKKKIQNWSFSILELLIRNYY